MHSYRLRNSRFGKPVLYLAGLVILTTFPPSLDIRPHPSRACTWPPHRGHFFLSHLFWLKTDNSERTSQLDWEANYFALSGFEKQSEAMRTEWSG